MQNALITGVTGQDGFFLADLLLKKKYQVFGFSKEPSSTSFSKETPDSRIHMIWGDITNKSHIITALQESEPTEIYHLASQSQPGKSWNDVAQYLTINGLGSVQLFEAIKFICPKARVYHASSSEIFGKTSPSISLQSEQTSINPINPYAASKAYAHQMAKIYRKSHGLFISNGILFNHESERRPLHFLTQKVAYGAACAALDINTSPDNNEYGKPIVCNGKLALGNLNVAKDWGYAPDFVEAMWLILQHDVPDDFVIGTGTLHTVGELCEIAYCFVGKNWRDHIISEPIFFRPLESAPIAADSAKAQNTLSWQPTVTFEDMVKKMVNFQIRRLGALKSHCLKSSY